MGRDIPGALDLTKATKTPSQYLEGALISVLTGNPDGRVLFLASINPAPLTNFDAGGHLARRGLLWSLAKAD